MKPAHTALGKRIENLGHGRYQTWQVFSDFVEMAAISLSNAVDLAQRDKREERYLQIVKGYRPEEVKQFPEMFGELVHALEQEPADILGATFSELDLGGKWTGQFFTPQTVSDMMAQMVLGDRDGIAKLIEERGYFTLMEPAVGAGVMVISAAKVLRAHGFNWQRQMHVTAVDVDDRAVHMAYIQFALLGIPAVIVHGNSLTLEERGHWYTPAHVLGFWSAKLRSGRPLEALPEPSTGQPQPALLRAPALPSSASAPAPSVRLKSIQTELAL